MPSEHAAHIVKINRHIRYDDDCGGISAFSPKMGGSEQNHRQQQQNGDAGDIDEQYDLWIIHSPPIRSFFRFCVLKNNGLELIFQIVGLIGEFSFYKLIKNEWDDAFRRSADVNKPHQMLSYEIGIIIIVLLFISTLHMRAVYPLY